jgi:hypothetical protein
MHTVQQLLSTQWLLWNVRHPSLSKGHPKLLYFVPQLFTNMVFRMILPEWRIISFRKLVPAAMLLFVIRISRCLAVTVSLSGSVTWADVEGIVAVYMHMKQ